MSTSQKVFAPAKGLVVIDPATSRALPPEGSAVQGHPEYWQRRLNDGDVVEVQSKPKAATSSEDAKVNKS